MVERFTYSIIIPHRNSEATLRRCLTSIPRRDDVQVIVADDCSDERIDWGKFQADFPGVRVLLSNKCLGAGNARNRGLDVAEGKWLLFADADDFYADGFLGVLDKYSVSDLDILFFNATSVDSETLGKSFRADALNQYMKRYEDDGACRDEIMFYFRAPWTRMVNRQFVEDRGIRFEEVAKGNDQQFAYVASYCAIRTKITSEVVYVCTYSSGSVTFRKPSLDAVLNMMGNVLKSNYFFAHIGHPEWRKNIVRCVCVQLLRSRSLATLGWLPTLCFNYARLYKKRAQYVVMAQEAKAAKK